MEDSNHDEGNGMNDEDVTAAEQNEAYPPDPDEGDMDGPGMNVPRPRSAAIRGAIQGQVRSSKHSPGRKVRAGGGHQKNSNRILAQQKRRTVVEMRKAGATYEAIAQAVGYKDGGGARKAFVKAMGEIVQEPVAELKVLQVERLNHMLVAIWQRVQMGDLQAMNMALSIMNKMDALQGTEAAQRIEVTNDSAILVVDGSKDDYLAALKKMSGAGVQPDGSNAPVPGQAAVAALPAAQQDANRYPPGMGGTVTAVQEELTIEDGMQDVVDAVLAEDGGDMSVMVDDQEAIPVPTKKAFSWGAATTPKVQARKKEDRG